MPAETEDTYVQGLAQEIAAALAPLLDIRPLLTTHQAAERLGVSERTVRNMLERGELRSIIVSEGSRRIEPTEIDRYVASRRESGDGTQSPEAA
jgi:excisionase family DNA binding protein